MKKVLAIGVFLTLFVSNAVNTSADDLSDKFSQMQASMFKLAEDIEKQYSNKPADIESMLDYIEQLHRQFIILGDSLANTEMKNILPDKKPLNSKPLQWMIKQLIEVTKPMDELANVISKDEYTVKALTHYKLADIRFLHELIKFLKDGGEFEEAIKEVSNFEKNIKK